VLGTTQYFYPFSLYKRYRGNACEFEQHSKPALLLTFTIRSNASNSAFLWCIGAESPAQKFKYSIFKKYAAHFSEL